MSKLPSIPSISSKIPTEIRTLLGPMREILMAFTLGNGKVATIKSLKEAGVIDVDGSGEVKPFPGAAAVDYTPPPAPTGLTAGGALATVILSWDAVASKNIAYAEVWRADSDSFSLAQFVGRADGRLYTDSIGGGATRYYWIRYVSLANIKGPFNSQAGVAGETGSDASYLISVLSANPPNGASFNKLLYVQDAPTTINGVAVPAGTYMSQAYVANGSISNAKIGNAAIDNAKIASLDAAKITTGYIDAARINVGSLDAKIATLDAAVIGTGFLNMARINNASIDLAKINRASIASLSAITADLGAITAGSLNINNKFMVAADGSTTIQSSPTGQRTVMTNGLTSVYDSNNVLRVRLGVW